MTAHQYSEFTLRCDSPDCRAKFGPRSLSRAIVRRLAAKAGWTHVRKWAGRKYDEDFCPDHKPEEG